MRPLLAHEDAAEAGRFFEIHAGRLRQWSHLRMDLADSSEHRTV